MGVNSRYEIRVKGILDGRWTAWFEDLQVTSDGEETVIVRPGRRSGCPARVADQGMRPRAVPDLGTPPRSRLTIARSRPPSRQRRKHQEEIRPPVIMRRLPAVGPAATPIKNTDQARKESEK